MGFRSLQENNPVAVVDFDQVIDKFLSAGFVFNGNNRNIEGFWWGLVQKHHWEIMLPEMSKFFMVNTVCENDQAIGIMHSKHPSRYFAGTRSIGGANEQIITRFAYCSLYTP